MVTTFWVLPNNTSLNSQCFEHQATCLKKQIYFTTQKELITFGLIGFSRIRFEINTKKYTNTQYNITDSTIIKGYHVIFEVRPTIQISRYGDTGSIGR